MSGMVPVDQIPPIVPRTHHHLDLIAASLMFTINSYHLPTIYFQVYQAKWMKPFTTFINTCYHNLAGPRGGLPYSSLLFLPAFSLGGSNTRCLACSVLHILLNGMAGRFTSCFIGQTRVNGFDGTSCGMIVITCLGMKEKPLTIWIVSGSAPLLDSRVCLRTLTIWIVSGSAPK